MSTYTLTHSISQRLVSFSLPQINWRTVWISGFILITFLLVFYIFQVNEMTKAGFFVSNYQRKIAELSQENKNLEINFSQVNSLANLEILLNNFNYEKIEKVHYLKVLGTTVVAK